MLRAWSGTRLGMGWTIMERVEGETSPGWSGKCVDKKRDRRAEDKEDEEGSVLAGKRVVVAAMTGVVLGRRGREEGA